jgi:hypothetical protein
LQLDTPASRFLREAANGEIGMNAPEPKLQAAEHDLKQLMADVTRAMEKAQEAVARLASRAAAAETQTEADAATMKRPSSITGS